MTAEELAEIKSLLEDIRVELVILNRKIPQTRAEELQKTQDNDNGGIE